MNAPAAMLDMLVRNSMSADWLREFIVPDQRAERLAAQRAEFARINALEGVALVEVRGFGQVFADFRLRGVEHFDLQHRIGEVFLTK